MPDSRVTNLKWLWKVPGTVCSSQQGGEQHDCWWRSKWLPYCDDQPASTSLSPSVSCMCTFLSCKTLSCMRSLKFLRNENIALTKFYIDGQMLVCGIIGHYLGWGLDCRQLASMGRRMIVGLSTSLSLFCQPCLISRGDGSINFSVYARRSIHSAWPGILTFGYDIIWVSLVRKWNQTEKWKLNKCKHEPGLNLPRLWSCSWFSVLLFIQWRSLPVPNCLCICLSLKD